MRTEITLFSIVVAAALSAATVAVLKPAEESFLPADGQRGDAARQRQDRAGPGQPGHAELSTRRDARQNHAGARPGSGNQGQASR